jgi:hypothetical protein
VAGQRAADLGEEVLADVERDLQAQLVRKMHPLEHSPGLRQFRCLHRGPGLC